MGHLDKKIILFDGVCNLCNSTIQFIIKRDKNTIFRYASLQSNFGKKLLLKHQSSLPNTLDSIILINTTQNKAYYKSSAALQIAKHLNGLYPILYVGMVLPTWIRDSIYSFIAKNRYKWFGKLEQCSIPSPELKKLFLDQ